MPDFTRCPSCARDRVDEGAAQSHQYDNGLWIGCTACGFSVSGPDHAAIRAAWASCVRSSALRNLRLAPMELA
jgi:ribosomal protein L37AE/L43A